jgi:hypothetical protein
MKAWRIAGVLAVVVSVSWPVSASSQALGLYDAFSSGRLDPERWLGYEYTVGKYESHPEALLGTPDWSPLLHDPTNSTSVRQVVGGHAQIALTSHRRLSGALYGGGAKARSGLRINHLALADHSPAVTAFGATVIVMRAAVPTIPPDMICYRDVGMARAEILGHFFNDGTSTGPEDLTGDVFAAVALVRRVDTTLSGDDIARNVVEATVGRCNNPDCSRVRGGEITFARSWTTRVRYALTIVWQPASNAFVFTVAGDGPTESLTVPYTWADRTPVRGYAYDLRVENRPRRCYTEMGAPNQVPQEVAIDARFDNVQLNSAAAAATR